MQSLCKGAWAGALVAMALAAALEVVDLVASRPLALSTDDMFKTAVRVALRVDLEPQR